MDHTPLTLLSHGHFSVAHIYSTAELVCMENGLVMCNRYVESFPWAKLWFLWVETIICIFAAQSNPLSATVPQGSVDITDHISQTLPRIFSGKQQRLRVRVHPHIYPF